ncbi:MAG: metal-dependent hydrolase [Lentisphaerae bacterium]|jgi:uncharacterized protein|nr:metal-dependent hydrolase [Lentisphaerota bacterium]MBT4814145.1 metal-dependent hydrolase [Lentisphaerota bacterium]MBT5607370.1 metal-dependent hydrolase [Lentisphaerota bacterium]MBT7058380.1 metal-dependent hydrolase [Lentisphaerota bacterium]MBT7841697.1 metal-dependent hydrolase [Lentisphaerota bacterium]
MIYDANTWIGHWPFRALPRRSARELLDQMDKHGIEKALVGSLHGLFYKDAHEANHELVQEIQGHRDRLLPCAVLNPTYYGWQDDLRQCREEYGTPVLRLVPDYHGYALTDACTTELISAAHALNMRVALIDRVVDPRGRHPLDPGREAKRDQISAVLSRFPQERFLMLNFSGLVPSGTSDGQRNLYDITRILGGNGLRLEREITKHGAKHFVVGSTMLLRYGKPAYLALEKCQLDPQQRAAVEHGNLTELVPELAG